MLVIKLHSRAIIKIRSHLLAIEVLKVISNNYWWSMFWMKGSKRPEHLNTPDFTLWLKNTLCTPQAPPLARWGGNYLPLSWLGSPDKMERVKVIYFILAFTSLSNAACKSSIICLFVGKYSCLDYNCPKSKVSKVIKINAGNSVTYNTNPDAGNT